MFAIFKRAPELPPDAANEPVAAGIDTDALVRNLSKQASELGYEAAEVRGNIEDTSKMAAAQALTMQSLAQRLQEVLQAQSAIGDETTKGRDAVARSRSSVEAVANEVGGIVDTLHQVSEAAAQITQIALQTRLVAFNASVEAKRAGDAGRGFGVVAEAVKELAARVEASSKDIMGTVTRLDTRIGGLAREIQSQDKQHEAGAVHRALAEVDDGVARILVAANQSQRVCDVLRDDMGHLEKEIRQTTDSLQGGLKRTETFLKISEQLIETVADCGMKTADTPYIEAAQAAARDMAELLEKAVRERKVNMADLFDEQYRAVEGTSPQQHLTRFVSVADEWFPKVQEKVLAMSDQVVFCISADRNGYIACHNRQYNHPQRPGDTVWNTANCRNRRIFNDRTGLASARNQRPFLVQTYRRDMGGGRFVVLKEVAAPITVGGRHWGGLRLAYKF